MGEQLSREVEQRFVRLMETRYQWVLSQVNIQLDTLLGDIHAPTEVLTNPYTFEDVPRLAFELGSLPEEVPITDALEYETGNGLNSANTGLTGIAEEIAMNVIYEAAFGDPTEYDLGRFFHEGGIDLSLLVQPQRGVEYHSPVYLACLVKEHVAEELGSYVVGGGIEEPSEDCSGFPCAERQAAYKQATAAANKAYAQLPEDRRMILEAETNGMPLTDLAQEMGRNPSTVRSQLRRARRSLRKAAQPYLP